MDVKIGMKADGTMTAGRAEFRMQGGAFPGSPLNEALECAFAAYKLPAVEHIGHEVLANRPKAAAYRAPGAPMAGTPLDAAFIGSCTNSRISDLRRAAALLKGRRIAPGIRKALVVPGSLAVKRQAEAEGLDKVFEAAGFEWRMSGCSLCFYAGGEGFAEGSRVISSTNRNFEGRQGPGIRTHIASPETVAASAIAGVIADPRELAREGAPA